MIAWILSLMLSLVPKAPWDTTYPQTATAIAEAAEESALFAGEQGPAQTAALLVALAYYESSFRPDAVGDKGASVGLYQISRANLTVPSSWVMTDARLATREALRLIRISQQVCRGRPLPEMLGWYASGGAGCRGAKASRLRMGLANHLWTRRKEIAWSITSWPSG
jgi:transglycosylase-like protein with SLT domain